MQKSLKELVFARKNSCSILITLEFFKKSGWKSSRLCLEYHKITNILKVSKFPNELELVNDFINSFGNLLILGELQIGKHQIPTTYPHNFQKHESEPLS